MLENIAVVKDEKDGSLGHLFWYSIGDDLYGRQTLKNVLTDCGLSESFMPKEIRPVDAFRRATKEIETRRPLGNGISENYIVRDVYSDTQVAVRHIVKEKVDARGKRLSYEPQAAVLTLDKKNDFIDVHAKPDSVADNLGREAQKLYDVFKENHNGQAIRSMVQSILKTLSPTPVRPSGGIYFIPSAKTKGLLKLAKFCSSFAKGEGFKVPVVESQESLEMVAMKVGEHLEGVLNQCRNALADGSLTKGKLTELISEAKNVVGGYRDYEIILVKQKDDIESRIQLVRDSMVLLLDKVG